MESTEKTAPFGVQFNLVDGRGSVMLEDESARQAVSDRYELGVALEDATRDFQQLLQSYNEGTIKDQVVLCRSYRLESLGHKYRCLLLVEYILRLHSGRRGGAAPDSLPPVPMEIMWYLNPDGIRHGRRMDGF